jgi:hypothetical protein
VPEFQSNTLVTGTYYTSRDNYPTCCALAANETCKNVNKFGNYSCSINLLSNLVNILLILCSYKLTLALHLLCRRLLYIYICICPTTLNYFLHFLFDCARSVHLTPAGVELPCKNNEPNSGIYRISCLTVQHFVSRMSRLQISTDKAAILLKFSFVFFSHSKQILG